MLWVAIASTYTAMLGALDIVYTLFAVSRLGADPPILGLLGALWIASYSIAAQAMTKVADNGRITTVKILSIALLTASIYLFLGPGSKSLTALAVSYALLAVALAAGRAALSAAIFENFDSAYWASATNFNTLYTSFTRGLFLVAVALLGLDTLLKPQILGSIAVAIALGYVFTVRSPGLYIERKLFIAEKSIKRASLGLRAAVALEDGYPAHLHRYIALATAWSGSLPIASLLIALGLFIVGNELALTPLPYYLNTVHGVSNTMFLYGLATAISAITASIIVTTIESNRRDAAILALSKILFVAALVYVCTSLYLAMTALIAIYAISTSFEIAIYGMYVDETGGYRMDLYYITCEIAAVIGSLVSGFLATALGYGTLILIACAITISSLAFLARAPKL